MSFRVNFSPSHIESEIFRLLSALPGVGTVRHQFTVCGESGMTRDVDGLACRRIGDLEVRILFVTSRRGRKLGVNDVLEIESTKADIGAHLAIVLAAAGYEDGAKEKAGACDIMLLRQFSDTYACLPRFLIPAFIDVQFLLYAPPWELDPEVYPELEGWLRDFWDTGAFPEDLQQFNYQLSVPCFGPNEELTSIKVRLHENRFTGTRRVPISVFPYFARRPLVDAEPKLESEKTLAHILQTWETQEEGSMPGSAVIINNRSVRHGSFERGIWTHALGGTTLRCRAEANRNGTQLAAGTGELLCRLAFRPR